MNKKTAFVTGGSTRLGKEISLALASQGYDIVFTYHASQAESIKTCEEIQSIGVSAHTFYANLEDVESQLGFYRDIFLRHKVSIVVNNAGIFERDVFKSDQSSLQKHLNVNLFPSYWFTKLLAQLDVENGLIVNIIDAKIAYPDSDFVDYIISKAALEYFTRLSATLVAPKIRVNSVSPGAILPPPTADLNSDSIRNPLKNLPLNHYGTPAAIAKAVMYLVDNEFITGTNMMVDGGASVFGFHSKQPGDYSCSFP